MIDRRLWLAETRPAGLFDDRRHYSGMAVAHVEGADAAGEIEVSLAVHVDDLGAGYSNLKLIADLQPRVVKLDRNLIQDLDRKPRQQKLS